MQQLLANFGVIVLRHRHIISVIMLAITALAIAESRRNGVDVLDSVMGFLLTLTVGAFLGLANSAAVAQIILDHATNLDEGGDGVD